MEKIGKYRVLGKIGQGGMASVYLVEDERIGKRWAVKAISKSTLPKEGILLNEIFLMVIFAKWNFIRNGIFIKSR